MSTSSFKPTIIGIKAPAIAPTRIGALPQPAVPAGEPGVSALPGVPRRPLNVAMVELRQRFPCESGEVLTELRAFLAGVICGTGNAEEWVAYGEGIQRNVSGLISRRLAANDQETRRTVPRHLARLHELLQAMAESFSAGGLLRPTNPLKTWEAHRPEIERLGKELDLGLPRMVAAQVDTREQMTEAHQLKRRIRAVGLAADVLAERLAEQNAGILAGRQASLLGSEALLDELLVQLELDELRWAALIEQIRDGVLVRLPGLMNFLAELPAKPNDTERFLLVERLAEVIQFFERKR